MIRNPSGKILLNEGEYGFLSDLIDYMATSDFDIVKSIANRITGTNSDPNKINIGSNIAKAAAGLTAVFPVIVTEAVPLDQAVMISKAIERKCVAMLQMLFAANQITTSTGAFEYMKRFHTNMDPSMDLSDMDVDDIIDYTNKGINYANESKSLLQLADMDVDDIIVMSDQQTVVESNNYVKNVLREANVSKIIKEVNEMTKELANEEYVEEGINYGSLNEFRCTKVLNEYTFNKSGNRVDKEYHMKDIAGNDLKFTKTFDNTSSSTDVKNAYEILNKNVLKTDIQKANEATPSLMVINFTSTVDNGDSIINTCVIGVKARIHYVPSQEMITRIIMKNTDRRGFFNFLRATTGEIAFFKDFLFAIDKAKIDAVAKAGKGSTSKIWKLLELRADRAKLNKSAGRNTSAAAAISTIVISRAEADIIKKNNRIDITKPGTLLSIMRGYNLMCAVIVDEVSERCDFMYDDGTTNFETLSFMSLEREDSGGSYKKVINLLAKGR